MTRSWITVDGLDVLASNLRAGRSHSMIVPDVPIEAQQLPRARELARCLTTYRFGDLLDQIEDGAVSENA